MNHYFYERLSISVGDIVTFCLFSEVGIFDFRVDELFSSVNGVFLREHLSPWNPRSRIFQNSA